MSRVSVVIPNYNRADIVIETIRNLQAQTLSPHEIIVVDDGSTDGSQEAIRTYSQDITLIEQENQGPGAARNRGFKAATGDLIQFMDSDDLASLNKLEVQSSAIVAGDAEMAFGPWLHIHWGKGIETRPTEVLQTEHPGGQFSLLEWHLRGWALVLQNCLFRHSFLEKIGPQKTDLLGTEDWEFFNRIFLANPRAVFTPECLTLYRLHEGGKLSGSGTSAKKKAIELAKAARYINLNLKNDPPSISSSTIRSMRYRFWGIERASGGQVLETPLSFLEHASFQGTAILDRLKQGLARRLFRHSWPSFYHPCRPNSTHLKMMADAGII